MNKMHLRTALICTLILALSFIASCSGGAGGGTSESGNALAGYELADMSGYDCFEGTEKIGEFADLSVMDVKKLIEKKESFVLYLGFANCPWCNILLPQLSEVMLEKDCRIAYIDTRKDPSWSSNLDLADYDVFVEYFGDYLDTDADGKKHLYVPDMFFVKDGEIVQEYAGVLDENISASDVLTDQQKEKLRGLLREAFEKVE